jgi:hypothetical protein
MFACEYLFIFVDVNFDSFISRYVICGTHMPYVKNQQSTSIIFGNHLNMKKFKVIFHKGLVMSFSSVSPYVSTGGS